jgi:hypothetical protein
MIPSSWKTALVSLPLVVSMACTSPPVMHEEIGRPSLPSTSGIPQDRRVLAGEWDYEDGAVVTLTLDEQGNGSYPWKDGRFVTHSLSDHVWQGMWIQNENDREEGSPCSSLRIFPTEKVSGGIRELKTTGRQPKKAAPSA